MIDVVKIALKQVMAVKGLLHGDMRNFIQMVVRLVAMGVREEIFISK